MLTKTFLKPGRFVLRSTGLTSMPRATVVLTGKIPNLPTQVQREELVEQSTSLFAPMFDKACRRRAHSCLLIPSSFLTGGRCDGSDRRRLRYRSHGRAPGPLRHRLPRGENEETILCTLQILFGMFESQSASSHVHSVLLFSRLKLSYLG